MDARILRNAGCALITVKAGMIVSHLEGSEELFRFAVTPAEMLLTDHKIIDAAHFAALSEQGLLCQLQQVTTFSVQDTSKLIIHGVDQAIVNLDHHGWPVFEAGSYTVYAVPPVRSKLQLFLYVRSSLA